MLCDWVLLVAIFEDDFNEILGFRWHVSSWKLLWAMGLFSKRNSKSQSYVFILWKTLKNFCYENMGLQLQIVQISPDEW